MKVLTYSIFKYKIISKIAINANKARTNFFMIIPPYIKQVYPSKTRLSIIRIENIGNLLKNSSNI